MKRVIYLLLVFLVGTASSGLAQTTKFAMVDKFNYPRHWFTIDLDNQRLYEHPQKGGDYYYLIKEYTKSGDVHKFSLHLAHSPSFRVYDAELVLSGPERKYIKIIHTSGEVRYDRDVITEGDVKKKSTSKSSKSNTTQDSSLGSRVKKSAKQVTDDVANETENEIKEKVKKETKKAIKKLFKF